MDKAQPESLGPAVELPPMIVGVLHKLKSLLGLSDQDHVEDGCALKASQDDESIRWGSQQQLTHVIRREGLVSKETISMS